MFSRIVVPGLLGAMGSIVFWKLTSLWTNDINVVILGSIGTWLLMWGLVYTLFLVAR